MSEQSEEKTLPPSQKKLDDARKKGQLAHSNDFVSAVVTIATIAYLWIRSGPITQDWREAFVLTERLQSNDFDTALMQLLPTMLALAARTLLPLLGVAVGAALFASIIVNRGFVFSMDPVMPKLEHLNPIAGLKRLFGMRSLIELVKTFLKTLFLTAALGLIVLGTWRTLVFLPACGADCVGYVVGAETKLLFSSAIVAFIAAGLLDILLQRWLFVRDMRMSPTEMKREMQELEGNPLVRSAHQRLRQESATEARLGLAQATMLVIAADVAIGLRYVRGETGVPIVVCRAKGDGAIEMAEAGRALGTPVVADAVLARALAKRPKLGGPLPAKHFERIAKALFQLGLAG